MLIGRDKLCVRDGSPGLVKVSAMISIKRLEGWDFEQL